MAAQAVICAACGAKVKSGRVKCLRCGAPLVARADAPAPLSRPIPWKIVGFAAGCVVLGGVAVTLTGREQPSQSTTPTMVVDASRVPSAPARSAGSSSQATAPDPASTAVSDLMAGQQAYVSGNIDASVQQLQAAVDANPNDPRALSDLGQVLVRTGRAREAVTYLDKAVSLKSDSWAYQFNRARAYAQLQDWGQAIEGYRTAARLFPDDYATQYNLAKALQASGDIGAALAAYEKAIELAPGQSDFQLSYGSALETAKRPQDAAAAYRRYLELEPNSPQAEKVKAHLAGLRL
ncbi:MAG TPA: tetratricopeptide repeat protein [Vicinamibacterales bacterium]|nr:tetratricopeptide repeat protein [Vicinamibacterales bacterium]